MERTDGRIPSELGHLPVAVIGAGPIGLAVAARLFEVGVDFVVFEAGETAGTNVADWAHVRMFSPWDQLVDPVAVELLTARGWTPPPAGDIPTGGELIDHYLAPLASLPGIAERIRYAARVVAVHRRGHDKVKSGTRASEPFVVRSMVAGSESSEEFAAVVDASGTWANPNPLGAGGVPALGEAENAGRIDYRIPDVLGRDRADHAGRRVMVAGSGHSAANAVLDLVALAELEPGTTVAWAIRSPDPARAYGTGEGDALPARGGLGERLRRAVEAGAVELVPGFSTERVAATDDGRLQVVGVDGRVLVVDRVVAVTGQRPDLSVTRELRLDLDPWLEAPRRLAPMIDPNIHTCGTVEPHGFETLRHPEPGYVTVGIKSYGRAPTFLTRTGYEQVRSVVAALVGDGADARSGATASGGPALAACCA